MPARWVEVAALVVLAWSIAVPLARWFATRRWPTSAPLAALLVWQAIGLAGGLSLLTAELTLAASGRSGPWRDAVAHTLTHPTTAGAVGIVGLALLVVSAAWLLGVLATSFVRVRRSRAGHRAVLELLATPTTHEGAPVDVVEVDTPLAYSLPRSSPRTTAHVVVSTATRHHLDPLALRAVLAHERAHLRQRHNLVVQPFVAWERSLPFLAPPVLARIQVELLVELACDDVARRETSDDAVRRALDVLTTDRPDHAERLARLQPPATPPTRRARTLLALAAVVLVAAPPALLVLLPV